MLQIVGFLSLLGWIVDWSEPTPLQPLVLSVEEEMQDLKLPLWGLCPAVCVSGPEPCRFEERGLYAPFYRLLPFCCVWFCGKGVCLKNIWV